MKKTVGFALLLVLTAVSISLAAAPKPMACDSFKCGPSCAPAKYVAVRTPPTLPPLFASPVYGAAVIEGGIGLLAVLFGARLSVKRRAKVAREEAAPAGVLEAQET